MANSVNYILIDEHNNDYIYKNKTWKDKFKKKLSLINFILIIILYLVCLTIYFTQIIPFINKANDDMNQLSYINSLKYNITSIIDHINNFCKLYNISELCG